jgi:16S rRNA (guanine1207-N2)-methyltransferase
MPQVSTGALESHPITAESRTTVGGVHVVAPVRFSVVFTLGVRVPGTNEAMTGPTDRLSLASHADAGPPEYHFETADGLDSPDQFRDAELALLEALSERTVGNLLVVQANYGVVGVVLAAFADGVRMTETSARATRFCRRNVALNDATAEVSLVDSPAALGETFETACYAPAGYTPIPVGKQRLVDALPVLDPGGRLFVAGETATGLDRYERCLTEHCPRVEAVHERGDLRVVAATRPDEFDPPRYVTPRTIEVSVAGVDLSLVTVPGLFSPGELDHGTRHLIETATVEDGEDVLDLACGYGPVGTWAASVADVDVTLADDDVRATACAEGSLDATGVAGTVVTADGTRGIDRRFDRILCNPPTHAGSGILTDLFAGAADVLRSGGEMAVVHHETLNLDEYLRQVGEVRARHRGEEHTVVVVEK